jgi:hypothetical protein
LFQLYLLGILCIVPSISGEFCVPSFLLIIKAAHWDLILYFLILFRLRVLWIEPRCALFRKYSVVLQNDSTYHKNHGFIGLSITNKTIGRLNVCISLDFAILGSYTSCCYDWFIGFWRKLKVISITKNTFVWLNIYFGRLCYHQELTMMAQSAAIYIESVDCLFVLT